MLTSGITFKTLHTWKPSCSFSVTYTHSHMHSPTQHTHTQSDTHVSWILENIDFRIEAGSDSRQQTGRERDRGRGGEGGERERDSKSVKG